MDGERPELVLPVVHPNGTSAAELVSLRMDTYSALSRALEVLRRQGPNGRDYYPDPGRMQRAEEQHRRRMQVITDLMDEIEDECVGIQADQPT